MSKVETVYIHHPELGAEAQVPASTVVNHMQSGWVAGRLPEAQEADEAAAAAEAEAARQAADDVGAAAAERAVEAAATGATVDPFGHPLAPQIAGRRSREQQVPAGDETTTPTPEEGPTS